MKKKILIGSILAAVLIVLASLTSAVGTNALLSNGEKVSIVSPLFSVRSQRSLDIKSTEKISSHYLGEGKQLNIFLPEKSKAQILIDKAIKIFDTNPALFNKLLEKLEKTPYLARMLKKYDVNKDNIKNCMRIIKNNPSIITEEIENIQIKAPINNLPQPLGLETSFFECLITAIVLAPVAAIITLLALGFTLRILTCLNVNNCGDELLQRIWEQLTQGLLEG